MITIKVRGRWVEYVTEERPLLTDDPERAACYSWEGSVRAEELVRYQLTVDESEKGR